MEFVLGEIKKEMGFTFPKNTVFKKGRGNLKLEFDGKEFTVTYSINRQLFRAAVYGKTIGFAAPFSYEEKETVEDSVLMADCSRNAVYTVETVKKLIRNSAAFGYTAMELYTEETYTMDDEPCFGYLRGRYTKEELKEIDDYGYALGVEVIPDIQTLGHLENITKFPAYRGYFDCANILLVGEEKVYVLIEKMFATMRECFRTDKCNIGMDEAVLLGVGKYMDLHGYRDKFDIMTEHLNIVCALAAKYGFHPIVCSDMFWNIAKRKANCKNGEEYPAEVDVPSDVFKNVPKNVELMYWEYGTTDPKKYALLLKKHKASGRKVWFHACSWKWGGMLPSNNFSLGPIAAALKAVHEEGVKHILNGLFGDNGAEAGIFSVLPSVAYFGLKALDISDEDIKKQFAAVSGMAFDDFMKLELPNSYGEFRPKAGQTAKVMLYNDLFLGLADEDLDYSKKEQLLSGTNEVRALAHGQYAYLFRFSAALGDAIYAKMDLGKRLRTAYKSGDKKELAALVPEIRAAVEKVRIMLTAFRAQWFTEAKPHGFDVQDIRVGGLIGRMTACADRVEEYVNGTVDGIPELAETIIPGTVMVPQEGATFFCPRYDKMVTVNPM